MRSLFLIIISCFQFHSFAQTHSFLPDKNAGARERNVDFKHVKLYITLIPDSGKVIGKAEHTFVPLLNTTDSLFLDAPSIAILDIKLNNKKVDFVSTAQGVTIHFAAPLSASKSYQLAINYEAFPKKGIYFLGWNEPTPPNPILTSVRKQIWTQGQGIDNRHWIPLFDDMSDKMTSEIIIAFDSNYQVLSNGTLLSSKKQKEGTTLWHYKMEKPHAPYLIMLGIGKYSIKKSKTQSGVAINNWYYPEFPETIEPTFKHTEQMVEWMEKEFGVPYPWSAYSQIPVQDFIFGAMENTTATVFGDFYVVDERAFLDRNYISTNSHELVHQWFGDFITAWSAEDSWLQESFATHYQKHFERSVFGEDHFQWNRKNELDRVLAAAKNNNHPIRHTQAGTARIYPKGSLVLDMIRYVIGEEAYQKSITHYLKKHAYHHVNFYDFQTAFLEATGYNLDWFFEQWVLRGGEPEYEVKYSRIDKNKENYTQIIVRQTQAMDDYVGLFKMPIVFQVHYQNGTFDSLKIILEKETEIIEIPNPKNQPIGYVLFDPNSQIIKQVKFEKSWEELKTQAEKAPQMIDRYDALVAIRKIDFEKKKAELIRLFSQEKFYACRAEIAEQLAASVDILEPSIVQLILKDKHSKVRGAFLGAVHQIPLPFLPFFEALLQDSSYQNIAKALPALAKDFPDNRDKYLEITKDIVGSGNNVRIEYLKIAAEMQKPGAMQQFIELTGPQYEFRTRSSALNALKAINYFDESLCKNIFEALIHFNTRLNAVALSVAKHFYAQKNYSSIISNYYTQNKWSEDQALQLSKVFKD